MVLSLPDPTGPARPTVAVKGDSALQLRPNGLRERQQIVKVGADDRVEDIQVEFAVLMNRSSICLTRTGHTTLQLAIEQPRFNSLHFHSSFAEHQDEPGVLEIEDRVPADVRRERYAFGS
jgi:hypothetical protein